MTFTIAAWGFHGPANLTVEKAKAELAQQGIAIVHIPLDQPLPDCDVVWVQGCHRPSRATEVIEAAGDKPLYTVPPNAQHLMKRTAYGEGVDKRIADALRTCTPARLVHAALLCAGEDPGECPDDIPRGHYPTAAPADPVGTVGVAASGLHVAAGDAAYIDAVAEALVAQQLRPIVWLGDPSDMSEPVDVWLNLTGFTLTGNHGAPQLERGIELAEGNDAQLITPVPLQRGTLAEWTDPGTTGLWPTAVSMNIAIPELEGATVPWVFAGRDPSTELLTPVVENVTRLAERLRRLVTLRRTANKDRKLSITIFGHDGDGTVGTAAHLDVFESLLEFLRFLDQQGYTVELPANKDELIDRIVGDGGGGARSASSELGRLPAPQYARLLGAHVKRIEGPWRKTPGEVDTDGRDLIIRGAQFGNVVVGIQPQFGDVSDPAELLMRDDATPSHSFAAYYLWLEHVFGHDAMLHFGTHGALEFMPGRQTGLALDDWPLLLTGSVPHSYLYVMANPGEGTIAKRRSAAGLISYLTPPLADADLYGNLEELSQALDADASDIDRLAELCGFETGMDRAELRRELERIRRSPIAMGLHVLGRPMLSGQTTRSVELATTYGHSPEVLNELEEKLQVNEEMTALEHAFTGYTAPVPGGDPARRPDALPTGRNIHGVDPATVPTPNAWERGRATAEELIQKHQQEHGEFPETIAMVLWGIDNIKTQGEGIAQAFALVGAQPVTGPRGRVDSYRILPLEELGRPRVDVVCTLSGVCRDVMPNPIALLDEAIREIATLDEPLAYNPIARHASDSAEELDIPLVEAAVRIFSAAPGNYGTGVNKLIQAASWDDDAELAQMYLHRMGHAWGASNGAKAHAVLERSLGTVDATFQNVDSAETSLAGVDHYFEFLGGVTKTVEKLRGQAPQSYVSHAWHAKPGVETLQDAMRLESRTRILNPKWVNAQLEHGYCGVAQVRTRLENTYGMQATTGVVDGWVFDQAAELLLLDEDMRQRMEQENPAAVNSMTTRLLEAHDRGLWDASDTHIAELEELADRLDDILEGI